MATSSYLLHRGRNLDAVGLNVHQAVVEQTHISRCLTRGSQIRWFIAKTDLTPSAQICVREKGALVSTERELQALAERLGVRFAK